MQRRSRGTGFAGLLLVHQLLQVGLGNIPIITLTTLGLNAAIFYGLLDGFIGARSALLDPRNSCVSIKDVWYGEDWKRLILAAVVHGDEWHLYYNMVSFLWKGRTLERKYGSQYFAYLLLVFTPLVNITMLALNYLAAEYVLDDPKYLVQCAVGFSGVIFALKVLTTYDVPEHAVQYIAGLLPVPSRYACWAELVVIQLLIPNASFTGHLAGILVGVAYVKGPLRAIMNCWLPTAPQYTYTSSSTGYRAGGRSTGYASGDSDYARYGGWPTVNRYQARSQQTVSSADYQEYTGGLSEDEQLQRAMNDSLRSWPAADAGQGELSGSMIRATPSAPYENDSDAVRWRRLQRFQ